jgi:hypothetical protein
VRRWPLSLVLLALVSGCGGDSGEVASPSGSITELQITVSPEGRPNVGRRTGSNRRRFAATYSWTLRCDPPGGTYPDPARACEELAELDHPFAETPEDAECNEIRERGPWAVVQGVYHDETVDARFDRDEDCEIARWDKHDFLFVRK